MLEANQVVKTKGKETKVLLLNEVENTATNTVAHFYKIKRCYFEKKSKINLWSGNIN